MKTTTLPLALLVALLAAGAVPAPAAAQSQIAKEHEIEMHEFEGGGMHLSPDVLRADVGDTLRITVNNPEVNTAPHNLVVCGDPPHPGAECEDVLAFVPDVPAGESRELTFTVEKAGEFEYFCQVFGHKAATPGMKGKLIVQGEAEAKETPAPALLGALGALALGALVLRRR